MCTWFKVTVSKEVTFNFYRNTSRACVKSDFVTKKINLSFYALEKYLIPYIKGKYHISLQIILLLFFIYASRNILEPEYAEVK